MNDTKADIQASSRNDFLQQLIEVWAANPFGRHLNIKPIDVGDGFAVFEAFPKEHFRNPQGVVHGGFHAALIDTAMGCAVLSTLGKFMDYGTIDLRLSYVRKIQPAMDRVLCRGAVIHRGGRLSTAEARIVDEAGKLYAHGTGTYMVYER
jgi:acyl-CoA thioesterase